MPDSIGIGKNTNKVDQIENLQLITNVHKATLANLNFSCILSMWGDAYAL